MVLDLDTLKKTLDAVLKTRDNELDCEQCANLMDQFAELQLGDLDSKDVPEALELVQHHLDICPKCDEVFQALLDALRALDIATE